MQIFSKPKRSYSLNKCDTENYTSSDIFNFLEYCSSSTSEAAVRLAFIYEPSRYAIE